MVSVERLLDFGESPRKKISRHLKEWLERLQPRSIFTDRMLSWLCAVRAVTDLHKYREKRARSMQTFPRPSPTSSRRKVLAMRKGGGLKQIRPLVNEFVLRAG